MRPKVVVLHLEDLGFAQLSLCQNRENENVVRKCQSNNLPNVQQKMQVMIVFFPRLPLIMCKFDFYYKGYYLMRQMPAGPFKQTFYVRNL